MENTSRAPAKTLVVIGGGMVAHQFVECIARLDQGQNYRTEIISEEQNPPYDRVHLTSYLESRNPGALQLARPEWYRENSIALTLDTQVVSIDPVNKQVCTSRGVRHFDQLVLATGSRPFVPPIKGIEHPKVFVYRTIGDLDAIADAARTAKRAAVIGGGLLGLEAAKALLDLGLATCILEGAPRLMPRQLDHRGAQLLQRKLTEMAIEVRVGAQIAEIKGDGESCRIEFCDGSPLDVDLLVVSAGIRPRDELAKASGIACDGRGGIVVDDALSTSQAGVYAIGECAHHKGTVYGLVAPGYAMAQILAERLVGNSNRSFVGADMSTKLKLLGVDVASAGDPFADEHGGTSVVLDSPFAGTYQKLVLDASAKRIVGAILVGDTKPFARILSFVRSGKILEAAPESLLMPTAAVASTGPGDDDLVCTCNGVCHKAIVDVIRSAPETCTVDGVKHATRAGSGCGGCLPQLSETLRVELSRLGKSVRPRLCEHFAYSRQELFELTRVRNYRTFEEILSAHGSGGGCEVCKPAIASILASVHNEHVLEHASLQDTNDRFLANIQRQGLYSIVPRIPGGEITPTRLAVIAKVADKYQLYAKITGGQRIDLFGARIDQLPAIWEELVAAGFESGHAYGKALRTVKSCVGSTWCRFGVNDSVGFAIRVENRYKGIRAPHKIKSAVSGCIRECAEVQSKDFGFIATEMGWNLYVCGNGGSRPRHADLLASQLDDAMALRIADRFLMFYIRTADKLTRTSTWLEGLEGGIARLREVIVNDSLGIAAELEQSMQQLVDSYECEWKRVINTPALRAQFERHQTRGEARRLVQVRGQYQPIDWPKTDHALSRVHLPVVRRALQPMFAAEEVPPDTGVTVKVGKTSIAIFHTTTGAGWYATQAQCPHKGDAVLGRGLLGEQQGVAKVACPFHKRTFSLETGECLNAESPRLMTFPVTVERGIVYLELPPVSELDEAFETAASLCDGQCHEHAAAAE
jgi:nitrite reductase (NADH) large subunit